MDAEWDRILRAWQASEAALRNAVAARAPPEEIARLRVEEDRLARIKHQAMFERWGPPGWRASARQGGVATMAAGDMESRVTKLETEMVDVKADLTEIKRELGGTAKRKDVEDLRAFFVERDSSYTRNLWRLVFGLVGLIAIIAAAAVGLTAGDVSTFFGR